MRSESQQVIAVNTKISPAPGVIPYLLGLSLILCGIAGCKREQRQFQQSPSGFKSYDVTMSDLRPGAQSPPVSVKNDSEDKAYDVAEGKRLFTQYNCVGCHFNGGGGIGPPLMDAQWIYGDKAENVYSTIVEGRPNG